MSCWVTFIAAEHHQPHPSVSVGADFVLTDFETKHTPLGGGAERRLWVSLQRLFPFA